MKRIIELIDHFELDRNISKIKTSELFELREDIKGSQQKLMVILRSIKSMVMTMPMWDILW